MQVILAISLKCISFWLWSSLFYKKAKKKNAHFSDKMYDHLVLHLKQQALKGLLYMGDVEVSVASV